MSKHTQEDILEVCADLADFLIAKNEAYGDSALNPVRIFSKADAKEQLLVRIDDKLSRLLRGHEYADDDTVQDLLGYLVLLKVAGKKRKTAAELVKPVSDLQVREPTGVSWKRVVG